VDLVFSQAAFEHFDDIDQTFAQLSETVKSGAVLIAEIDLNTHTRWLRDVDPLNIYRYSDTIYGLLKFRGSPNRLRPNQYKATLEQYGWEDVRIFPLTKVNDNYLSNIKGKLNPRFHKLESQIGFLSVMLCAKKK
jgi:trans-aconitate methyltransferase